MDKLKELVYVVTKNKLKGIDLLGQSKKKNRISKFYDKLANNEFETDEEASRFFFPKGGSGAAYRKLKASLRNRLVNSLFLIDVKQASYTDRQKAYYECHKNWAAAKMLLGKNAWRACVDLSRRTLKYAMQYEFTEMALDLIRILRLHYSTRTGNQKKFDEYKELHRYYEEELVAENKVELLYCELLIHYVNNRSTKEDLQQKASAYYEEIKCLTGKFDSYRLHLYTGLIRLMTYTMINDYRNTLVACDDIISFFEAKPYEAHTPLQAAYYQKLVCHSQLREFNEGRKAAKKCIALIEEGNVNWFKYYELYFTLAMQTEQYQEAYRVFCEVTQHKRFRSLPSNDQEVWAIYEAYLHYLAEAGKIRVSEDDDKFDHFRLGRFLNETPIFSKDKRGLNVAILSIQILFLIQRKEYNQAIDRLEAIEKYCNRYLRKNDTIRSYYFIKMLLAIPARSFLRSGVIQRAAPYLEKLKAVPLESARQAHKLEIVPFERLWEFALQALED